MAADSLDAHPRAPAMTTHVIKDSIDYGALLVTLERQSLPFTVDIRKGKHRTVDQNRLQFKWFNEIFEQTQEDATFESPEDVRGFCKLYFGVPIMREHSDFKEKYDRIIKPKPYRTKLELMTGPLEIPITRLMTTEQNTRYLDAIYKHFSDLGLRLTRPER